MSKRKLGFFVQIKDDDPADGGINHRNTLSISRINPAAGGIESDADMGEKDSFRSGTKYLADIGAKKLNLPFPNPLDTVHVLRFPWI